MLTWGPWDVAIIVETFRKFSENFNQTVLIGNVVQRLVVVNLVFGFVFVFIFENEEMKKTTNAKRSSERIELYFLAFSANRNWRNVFALFDFNFGFEFGFVRIVFFRIFCCESCRGFLFGCCYSREVRICKVFIR